MRVPSCFGGSALWHLITFFPPCKNIFSKTVFFSAEASGQTRGRGLVGPSQDFTDHKVCRWWRAVQRWWDKAGDFIQAEGSWVVWRDVLFEALALSNQRSLQDDPALFVPLAVFGSKLVNPAQLAVAVLAADIPHHVPSSEHHPVLHLTVLEVHHLRQRHRWSNMHRSRGVQGRGTRSYLVEEEGSARGTGKPCWDQLRSVGQDGVAVGAGEETCSANVVQEDAPHCWMVEEWIKATIRNKTEIKTNTNKTHFFFLQRNENFVKWLKIRSQFFHDRLNCTFVNFA